MLWVLCIVAPGLGTLESALRLSPLIHYNITILQCSLVANFMNDEVYLYLTHTAVQSRPTDSATTDDGIMTGFALLETCRAEL
jgi:hypothetical protein